MSRVIDHSVPLSDEDRQYLQNRSAGWEIEENDRRHQKGKFDPEYVEPFHNGTTVGAAPIEPGSPADNPPAFVGQRPYGVDRGVWGGSTGVSEDEALSGESNEPHHTPAEVQEDQHSEDEAESGVAIEDLSEEQLTAELSARGLETDGTKKELEVRLLEALSKED